MPLTRSIALNIILAAGSILPPPAVARDPDPQLEEVFVLPLAPAGLTVGPGGDFIISISFQEKPQNRVIQVGKTGESLPFPTPAISQAQPDEPVALDDIRGMTADKNGIIWMVDSGRRDERPPKIVAWDAEHKRLHRVIHLVAPSVLPGSNLHDLKIDPERQVIYLADSAAGIDAALIVLDLATGLARRVLQAHPSVVPVAGIELIIDGQKLQSKRLDGTVADPLGGIRPLALDRRGEWLYFGPLRSLKLYRIKTDHLRNPALPADKLAGLVEEYSAKPVCAGIALDSKGNIYVSDLNANAVGMISAGAKQYRVLASDPRLLWPDGLCFGGDGRLYFFNSVRNATPRGIRPPPGATNRLFRLQTPGSGGIGS